jgi:hypothetical protein
LRDLVHLTNKKQRAKNKERNDGTLNDGTTERNEEPGTGNVGTERTRSERIGRSTQPEDEG